MVNVKVDVVEAYRLLYPRPVVLVSCMDPQGKRNIITLSWSMPTSFNPPMVAVSIGLQRESCRMIKEAGEFVVNVPPSKLVREVLLCGTISGRNFDKFSEAGLTPAPARRVRAPIIEECIAHLECKVVDVVRTGDHALFVGEVLEAYAEENFSKRRSEVLLHLGGEEFTTPVK
nr:flavin reductase family protein [Candidatus Bathyarchaeota archaeon]